MAEYLRGAFIAYEPGGYPDRSKRRVIPFRINPEGFSRSISIEATQGAQGVEGASGKAASSTNEQSADASMGTVKETFSVQVRVDLIDRLESNSVALDLNLGILPEIAALEDLLYPAPSPATANADNKSAVQAHVPRPTVLFIWGSKRMFPVKLTQMSINETLHNAELNPVRAEIEVQMEVLRDADAASNPAVKAALDFTGGNRRNLSQTFLQSTAAQNTDIPGF